MDELGVRDSLIAGTELQAVVGLLCVAVGNSLPGMAAGGRLGPVLLILELCLHRH
jgi:hypothetical protein